MTEIYRAKAPLRLGFAGGGTDVSSYSNRFGGCVLNATINLYAHTYLATTSGHFVEFNALDLGLSEEVALADVADAADITLMLHLAVYRRVMQEFNNGDFLPLKISTFCDAPPGSGLGSSSALVVSMIEAYVCFLQLPLGRYDIATLAYEIERTDCGLAGGKQDQYAATFGGFNFMEFDAHRTVVNPLRVNPGALRELEASLMLFYLGASRDSAKIINDQIRTIRSESDALEAMHSVKQGAIDCKRALLEGDLDELVSLFRTSWASKKRTSSSITNDKIDEAEQAILGRGGRALKVSGAGGGGFMMVFINPESRCEMKRSLAGVAGNILDFSFTNEGCISWKV